MRRRITVEIAPGPQRSGTARGETAISSFWVASSVSSVVKRFGREDRSISKANTERIRPPAILNAGIVIPRIWKRNGPINAKTASNPVAKIHANRAIRTRSAGRSCGVIARKRGTVESGLIIANKETVPRSKYSKRAMNFTRLQQATGDVEPAASAQILPRNPLAERAKTFPRNRFGRCTVFVDGNFFGFLSPDQRDAISASSVRNIGDIDHKIIHGNLSENRCPSAADENLTSIAGKPRNSIGISGRYDRDPRIPL